MVKGRILDQQSSVARIDMDEMAAKQLEYDEIVDDVERSGDLYGDGYTFCRDVDVAESERDCPNDFSLFGYGEFMETTIRVEDYVGDLTSQVNIEALQSLRMLPKFVGDITDVIRHNLSESMAWTEGYTKKLG
jgi:hypothetical protein